MPGPDVDAASSTPPRCSECRAGEVGEIVTRGAAADARLLEPPRSTADAFVEIEGRRYLRTGDLGRVDEDGYFFMTDRLKRMINVSGYKVWPAEVESALHGHPAVQEACVIATPDARSGEAVKALVVPKPDAPLEPLR